MNCMHRSIRAMAAGMGIYLLMCIPVHFIGQREVFAGTQAADTAIVDGRTRGTFDHGIEKLEGFELINVLPSRIPFGEGENLVYSIQYGLITAGEATLEIRNLATLDSTLTYHIVSIARTNKVFDKVFKVRDRHESFMEYDNLYSLRFVKHLREGNYRKDRSVDFNQRDHLAVYADRTIPIAPNTHDFLTALYYIRTLDVEPGQAVAMANHTDHRNYPIYIKFLRRERVKVPAGEFDCIVVEPVLETSAIFENKGKLTIWMTDDSLRMPVMMRSKVIVGAFESVLKEYTLSTDEPRQPAAKTRETDGG
ncbi:MAG TPA: DUF3108 domain-containing protein [Candidatus Krumholzibacterium sp.]|nr:DUF3108 domain-containing protein [Candidatus Krumholzibacterium sp.]